MWIFKEPQVWAALITSSVTILVVLITTKSSTKQAKINIDAIMEQAKINSNTILEQSKSQRNIEAITKNRVEWMQVLKEYISEYVAIIQDWVLLDESVAYNKVFKKISISTNKIKLHLNFIGNKDQKILDNINAINHLTANLDKNSDYACFFKEICICRIQLLVIYVQIYLKTEWERVKFESENGNAYKFNFDEKFDEYENEKIEDIKKVKKSIERSEKLISIKEENEINKYF